MNKHNVTTSMYAPSLYRVHHGRVTATDNCDLVALECNFNFETLACFFQACPASSTTFPSLSNSCDNGEIRIQRSNGPDVDVHLFRNASPLVLHLSALASSFTKRLKEEQDSAIVKSADS